MLYSILIYDSEAVVDAMDEAESSRRIGIHQQLQESLRAEGRLEFVGRLMPSTAATSLRPRAAAGDADDRADHGGPDQGEPLVLDGPFAETKEQLLGLYVIRCDSLDDAVAAAKALPLHTGCYEVRPFSWAANSDGDA